MDEVTKQDLLDIAFYIGIDAHKESKEGREAIAKLLWAYRQDILEVLGAKEAEDGTH